MLSFLEWASNGGNIIALISAAGFFFAALLSLTTPNNNRKVATTITAVGFLTLLALAIATLVSDQASSVLVWTGILLVTAGHLLERTGKKITGAATKVVAKPATAIEQKVKQVLDNPMSPVKPKLWDQSEPATPRSAVKPSPKPVAAKAAIKTAARRAEKTQFGPGQRQALFKLPMQRRKQARAVVNGVIGLLVFIVVGWSAYAITKQILKPEPIDRIITPPTESTQPLPEEQPQEEVIEEEPEEEEVIEEPTESKPTVTILETETGTLNVRDGFSTATAIITTVNPGEEFELLEANEAGTWYKIQVDEDSAGWISARYAEENKDEDTEEVPKPTSTPEPSE